MTRAKPDVLRRLRLMKDDAVHMMILPSEAGELHLYVEALVGEVAELRRAAAGHAGALAEAQAVRLNGWDAATEAARRSAATVEKASRADEVFTYLLENLPADRPENEGARMAIAAYLNTYPRPP